MSLTHRSSDNPKPAKINHNDSGVKLCAEKRQKKVTVGFWFVMSPSRENPRHWTPLLYRSR